MHLSHRNVPSRLAVRCFRLHVHTQKLAKMFSTAKTKRPFWYLLIIPPPAVCLALAHSGAHFAVKYIQSAMVTWTCRAESQIKICTFACMLIPGEILVEWFGLAAKFCREMTDCDYIFRTAQVSSDGLSAHQHQPCTARNPAGPVPCHCE